MRLLLFSVLLPIVLGSAIPGQEKCASGPPYWCSHVTHARECGATKHCLQTVWKYQIIKPKSTATCTYCELIVNGLKDALDNKVTEDKIATLLANVCAAFSDSDTRDICNQVVTEYVPELIQMFDNDVSTDMICATLDLCSGLEDRWSPYGVKAKNTTYCTDCMKFFKDVQDSVTSNETLNELEQLLNQTVCSQLGGFGGLCNEFLAEYLPIALQTLAGQIDPDIVCRVFGFCGVTDKQVDVIKIKNIFSERLLKGELKYRSSEECNICKNFVQEIDSGMENQTLQNKLANEIKKSICPATGDFEIQCGHLMDGYTLKLIKMLANQLQMDPEITCLVSGLCQTDSKKVDVVQRMKSMIKLRKPKIMTGREAGEECDLCKDLFNQAVEFLRDKTTQDKVKYELENAVCTQFGSFEDECKQLVEEYLPMLFELLVNELDPLTVCEAVRLCTVPSLPEVQVKYLEPAAMVGHGYVKESFECTACKEIMMVVDEVLKQNDTIKTIQDFLDDICAKLPTGELAKQCEAFVAEYEDLVVGLIVKELDPKVFCAEAKLCSTTSVAKPKQIRAECQICVLVIKEVKALVAKISDADLLNGVKEVCSKLPGTLSASCTNVVNTYGELVISVLKSDEDPEALCELAKVCNATRVPYMTKPIPETLPVLKAPSEECEVCDTVIVMLKYFLQNNETKAEVKQALDAGCKELPSEISVPCQSLVQAYGDQIIDIIISELNATKICTGIGLCKAMKKPASTLSVVMNPYNTLPLVELPKKKQVTSPAIDCQLCGSGMQILLSKIGENKTKEKVEEEIKIFCSEVPAVYKGRCVKLIEEYGSEIEKDIIKGMDANQICVDIKMCNEMLSISAVMSPYDTLPILQPVSEKKESVKTGDVIECDVCKEIVGYVAKAFQNNATVEEIKAMLKDLCVKLPGEFKSKCTDFVDTYTQAVLNFLVLDFSPEKVCQELNLCQAVRKLPEPVHIKLLKDTEGLSKVTATPLCNICELVIKAVDALVQDNRSEVAIQEALDKVCSLFPDTMSAECESIVNTYSKVIINLIVQEIDPEEICSRLRLCATKQTMKTLMKTLPEKEKDGSKVKAGLTCVLCEFVMREVDSILEENATEAEIQAALDKVCSIIPDTVSAECKTLVKRYFPLLIQLLLEISPDQICTALRLCSSQIQWGTFVKILPEKTKDGSKVKAGPACAICEFVMKEVDSLLEENATEAEIKAALDKVCSIMPDTVSAECTALVKQYGPLIIQLLLKEISPDQICTALRLCSSQIQWGTFVKILPEKTKDGSKVKAGPACAICEFVMKEVDSLLEENATEAEIQAALDKVCSIMPDTVSAECTALVKQYGPLIIQLLLKEISPDQICTALRLCSSQIQWGTFVKILPEKTKDGSKVKAGPACAICEFVMKEVDSLLEENATEAEIQAALDKVCSLMPDTVSAECTALVKQYGPLIIQLLLKEISPDQICTALRLCSSQIQWGTFVKILPEKTTDIVECKVCEFLVTRAQQYLKENGTKQELETWIKKLCDELPDTVTVQCHDVVDQYVPAILDLIDQGLKPEEICKKVGVCATMTLKKDDSTLLFKPHRLIGQNKCTYGPAYWCANKDNAAKCNAMEHCMRHVWN